MIALLQGCVVDRDLDQCVVDVSGVGYLVRMSRRTIAQLPEAATPVRMWIETIVREDAIALYGFLDPIERLWFRLLTTVPGVGPNLALTVLSGLEPEALVVAIGSGDQRALVRLQGVGPKLAARLVTELQEKAPRLAAAAPAAIRRSTPATVAHPTPLLVTPLASDAISALENLGYRLLEAEIAVDSALKRLTNPTLDELIRAAMMRPQST